VLFQSLLEKEAAKQSEQKTGLSSQMLTALKPVVDGRVRSQFPEVKRVRRP
jgi:hypothetical protein